MAGVSFSLTQTLPPSFEDDDDPLAMVSSQTGELLGEDDPLAVLAHPLPIAKGKSPQDRLTDYTRQAEATIAALGEQTQQLNAAAVQSLSLHLQQKKVQHEERSALAEQLLKDFQLIEKMQQELNAAVDAANGRLQASKAAANTQKSAAVAAANAQIAAERTLSTTKLDSAIAAIKTLESQAILDTKTLFLTANNRIKEINLIPGIEAGAYATWWEAHVQTKGNTILWIQTKEHRPEYWEFEYTTVTQNKVTLHCPVQWKAARNGALTKIDQKIANIKTEAKAEEARILKYIADQIIIIRTQGRL